MTHSSLTPPESAATWAGDWISNTIATTPVSRCITQWTASGEVTQRRWRRPELSSGQSPLAWHEGPGAEPKSLEPDNGSCYVTPSIPPHPISDTTWINSHMLPPLHQAASRRRLLQFLAASPLLTHLGAPVAAQGDPQAWAPRDLDKLIDNAASALDVFDFEPVMKKERAAGAFWLHGDRYR